MKEIKLIATYHPFINKNKKAVDLFWISLEDYLACRCLLLNYILYPGLAIGQQAIEKIMKATILFKNSNFNIKGQKHVIVALSKVLKEDFNYDLSEFDELSERLEKHYNSRYPDNKNKSHSFNSGDLHHIDHFFLYLFDKIDIPDFIKYRNRLFGYLFNNPIDETDSKYRYYLLHENFLLNYKLEEYRKIYKVTNPESPRVNFVEQS